MKTKSPPSRLPFSRFVLCLFLAASASFTVGQTANKPASTEDEAVKLKEFVVSDSADIGYSTPNAIGVTRSNEALIDTPQTINVLNQQFLQDFNPMELADVLQFVAGVTIESNVGDSAMIRGYTVRDQFTDGMVDNQNQSQMGAEPFQYERIEVLKGPAGLVYGSTAIGGLTNRVRKAPQFKRQGQIAFTFGSYNQTKTEFDYTGPLSKTVAVRLVATYRNEDLVNGVPAKFAYANRWNANPSLLWRPTDTTQIRIYGEFLTERAYKHWGEVAMFSSVTNPAVRTLGTFPRYGERTPEFGVPQAQGGLTTWGLLPRDFTFGEQQSHGINYKQAGGLFYEAKPIPEWLLRIGGTVSFWDHHVEDVIPVGMAANNHEMTRTWRTIDNVDFYSTFAIDSSYSFKLLGSQHKLFAVTQYQIRGLKQEIFVMNPARPIPNLDIYNPVYQPYSHADQVANNNQWTAGYNYSAGFKDHVKFLGDKLQLAGGPRYDWFSTRTDNDLTRAVGRTNVGHTWTYNYGAIVKPAKSYSLFFGHTETYNPNFGAQPDGTAFPSQVGLVNEVGLKMAFLDGRIAGTVSTYDLRQEHILLADPDPIRNAQGWRIDSGKQVTKGYELDVFFQVTREWQFNVGGSKIDVTTPTGIFPRGSAKMTGNFATSYRFQTGKLKGLSLTGGIATKGKFNVETPAATDTVARYYLPGYTVGTVGVSYRWQKYTVQLNVTNPTDEWYLLRSVSKDQILQGPVRSYRLRISRMF